MEFLHYKLAGSLNSYSGFSAQSWRSKFRSQGPPVCPLNMEGGEGDKYFSSTFITGSGNNVRYRKSIRSYWEVVFWEQLAVANSSVRYRSIDTVTWLRIWAHDPSDLCEHLHCFSIQCLYNRFIETQDESQTRQMLFISNNLQFVFSQWLFYWRGRASQFSLTLTYSMITMEVYCFISPTDVYSRITRSVMCLDFV